MQDKILDEITHYCNECRNKECCPENDCVLFRIEQIVSEEEQPEDTDEEIMKLEVGMYARIDGRIGEIIDICTCDYCEERGFFEPTIEFEHNEKENVSIYRKDKLKASHNLLGNDKEPCLIEVGDVIVDKEGRKYPINYEFEIDYNNEYGSYEITIDDSITLFSKDGLSIVTKEQIESISYKVV